MSKTTMYLNEKVYELKQVEEGHTSVCDKCCFYPEQKGCPVLKDDLPCSATNLCYRIKVNDKHIYFVEM